MSDNKENKNINIQLDDSIAHGIYSNLVVVNHSPTEFVLDFINVMPGVPKAKVRSRVILSPEHTKKFIRALSDNLSKYEAVNGTIKDFKKEIIPLSFGPKGEA
jgi:hypothetical protein|tara:strand:+ start:196 stop:504 length:309 start_codon:yes stop_codon:yes gene_type:complete